MFATTARRKEVKSSKATPPFLCLSGGGNEYIISQYFVNVDICHLFVTQNQARLPGRRRSGQSFLSYTKRAALDVLPFYSSCPLFRLGCMFLAAVS